jgi:hypothetical protein
MKLITTTLALLALVCLTATAQVSTNATNANIVVNGVTYAPVDTNALEVVAEGKTYGGYELTLGGGGSVVKKESAIFGIDIGVSSNPFKKLPNLWVGINQGVYLEPSFSGSTDVYADWNTHLIGDLYVNTGWSVGSVYDKYEAYGRTGPEVTFQYYTSDNAFIYAGANYDFNFGEKKAEDGLRYSFGIGLSF